MPRKPTRTFHPLDMARSIEAQSAAVATKIWIVQGITGEYSDRAEWVVCAFRSEGEAKSMAETLARLAKAAEVETEGNRWEWEKTRSGAALRAADPDASLDYTGTDYTAFEIELR